MYLPNSIDGLMVAHRTSSRSSDECYSEIRVHVEIERILMLPMNTESGFCKFQSVVYSKNELTPKRNCLQGYFVVELNKSNLNIGTLRFKRYYLR